MIQSLIEGFVTDSFSLIEGILAIRTLIVFFCPKLTYSPKIAYHYVLDSFVIIILQYINRVTIICAPTHRSENSIDITYSEYSCYYDSNENWRL